MDPRRYPGGKREGDFQSEEIKYVKKMLVVCLRNHKKAGMVSDRRMM